jgi:hypothetical protein
MRRRLAIAIPARNEANRIEPCLDHLAALERDGRVEAVAIFVCVNNSTDDTAERARRRGVIVAERWFERPLAHAGTARRAAFELAAGELERGSDVLLSLDADTLVRSDWLLRTLDHLDAGYDAVAGVARFSPAEVRRLDRRHRARLSQIRYYQRLLDRLRGEGGGEEPWPRHFYEGGASMALTLAMYRRIGGAPAPPVGEDKALFEAVRSAGGCVRHPLDVRVATSCRLQGRASGGCADTLALWANQHPDTPIHDLPPLAIALGVSAMATPLTFASLAAEIDKGRALLRAREQARTLSLSA